MLCVTIFEWDKDAPLDQEAKDIWLWVGVENDRIVPLGKSDNRWWPAWATGPCGPDTEIFYRVWSWIPPTDSTPWNDEDNRLEIWNNVFMGYYKDADWNITEMENKNVDTGMGFERILMVIKGQELKQWGEIKAISELSVYDIDIFQSLLQNISEHTNISYDDITQEKNDLNIMLLTSFRIVADHLKTSLMLIQQWLAPSNEWRWYVLRRITRRGYYHLKKISVENTDRSDEKLLSSKIDAICSGLPTHYAQLSHTYKKDIQMLVEEMSQFESALQRWWNKIDEILSKHSWSIFSWDDAFLLYDTFGVPVELTVEIVASQGLEVDMLWYEAALETAKQTSRAWAWDKFAKWINRADHITWLSETRFIWYTDLECSDANILKDFEVGWDRYIVFDCTPFYAQWWWQNWDSWSLQLDTGEQINIVDVIKYAGVFLHKIG